MRQAPAKAVLIASAWAGLAACAETGGDAAEAESASGADGSSCYAQAISSPVDPTQGLQNIGVEGISAAEMEAALGDLGDVAVMDEASGTVSLYARWYPEADMGDGPDSHAHPHSCCSIQDDYERVADGLWAMRYRVERLDCAELMFMGADLDMNAKTILRGSKAIERAQPRETLVQEVEPRVVDSEKLGENRTVFVWASPGAEDGMGKVPVLLLADGTSLNYYARLWEPIWEEGNLAPFVVIGIASGRDAVEGSIDTDRWGEIRDVRAVDYLEGAFDDDSRTAGRFDAHLDFALDEAVAAGLDMLGVDAGGPIIVAGGSNGGAFAASAYANRPETVTHAIVMSRGYGKMEVGDFAPTQGRSIHFSAGLYEPDFLDSTQNDWMMAREAGADTSMVVYADGHAPGQWEHRLTERLTGILRK